MRFGENAGSVLDRRVPLGKARSAHPSDDPAFRVGPLDEKHIGAERVPCLDHRFLHARDVHIPRPFGYGGSHVAENIDDIGHHVLVVRAIRGVRVDEEIGKPLIEKPEPCPHLFGVRLEVVPVEVETIRRRPPPHLHGAVLVDPVVGTKPLVTIDVQDRDEKNRHVVEKLGELLRQGDIPKEHQAGVFAFDLTGVDPRLYQHHHIAFLARALGFRRCEDTVFARDEQREIPPLGALSEGRVPDPRRRLVEPSAVLDRFAVPGCRLLSGFLVIGVPAVIRSAGTHGACGDSRRYAAQDNERFQCKETDVFHVFGSPPPRVPPPSVIDGSTSTSSRLCTSERGLFRPPSPIRGTSRRY